MLRNVSCWQTPLYINYNYSIQYWNKNVYATAVFWYKDDSGGKVIILGGDSISHCEKEVDYEHVSNSEWLPRQICLDLHIENNCEW